MATLLHVTGEGHEPLPPFSGHLVRNLAWDRVSDDATDVDDEVDVVVLSATTPAQAARLVGSLRDHGRRQPVVLVADGPGGWAAVAGSFPAVRVVADRDGLDAVLAGLLGARAVPPEAAAAPVAALEDAGRTRIIDLRHRVPRGGGRELLRRRLGDPAPRVDVRGDTLVASPDGGRRPVGRAAGTASLGLHPGAGRRPGAGPTAVVEDPEGPRRARRVQQDPDVLVPALLRLSDRLYGLRETGTAVAGYLQQAVGVDAVAVLVPDGHRWAVAGGVGVGHAEERLTLGVSHWLVEHVARQGGPVVVDDSPATRARLAGAPLGGQRHLLASPVAAVGGVVLLARSDHGPAFGDRDLEAVSDAVAEVSAMLASAFAVRELARRLRTFAELDEQTPT